MYLDALAVSIKSHIPVERMPDGDSDELIRAYAVLLRAKGTGVTESDVHDAWAAWMAKREADHPSLVPYEQLTDDIRAQDAVFVRAIHRAAMDSGWTMPSGPSLREVLFPSGPPREANEVQQTLDLYKIMVQSSESLVNRRQGVNTFFLTINGALLTASGLVVQSSGGSSVGVLGIGVLAIAGSILCGAWRSLITSFGQLNRGKFKVINTIERHLKAAIYAAEWEALGRGENPKVYRSFTSREIWVPNALLGLHVLTVLGALAYSARGYWLPLFERAA